MRHKLPRIPKSVKISHATRDPLTYENEEIPLETLFAVLLQNITADVQT